MGFLTPSYLIFARALGAGAVMGPIFQGKDSKAQTGKGLAQDGRAG